ncbi:MAG: DinB family protein [Gammaproteobacteria bacterium]
MNTLSQPEHSPHPGACDSVAFLEQGLTLLRDITDEQFAATLPPVFRSGVGAHIRHILDHFDCLLNGIETGRVEYDGRKRDVRVELERDAAIAAIENMISRLDNVMRAPREVALLVKMDSGGTTTEWAESSVSREFQFLTSHTIHHYALVAAILGHAGCTMNAGFGISPSTLRHAQQ